MTAHTPDAPHADDAALETLYADMQRRHLLPLWTLEADLMPLTPRPKTQAYLWRYAELYDIAERSGRLVPVERGGDRRAIALSNPGLGSKPFATPTLWAAIQWLNGREVAPAHRHTSQAVRFIIDGAGSYSTVEGDKVMLERGDFVLTPQWLWHDHGSDSDERAVWMDGLDIPLTSYLDASFFEAHPDAQQTVSAHLNGSVLKYGVGNLRPAWEERRTQHPPMFTYKWAETLRALENLAQVDASPFDDVIMEYINPQTGGPVMHSFTCHIQMLRPGVHTRAHRQVCSSVYHCFEGQGRVIIDGTEFAFKQGDFFVIPTWAAHEFHNAGDERAILFSMHDSPLVKAMYKYREEALPGGHQTVTGAFGQ